MAQRRIQFQRGTTAQNEVFDGLTGELTVDTDKRSIVLHNGLGGIRTMVNESEPQTVINKTLSIEDNDFPGIDGDGLETTQDELRVDDTVVRTTGSQSISDIKTFTDPIAVNTGGGITTNQTTIDLFAGIANTINFGTAATNMQISSNFGTTSINNDLFVNGDFTVVGEFSATQEEQLIVEDKNIFLAETGTPTDTIANEGGIILRGDTDKTLLWLVTSNAWTSSENFDLVENKSYLIDSTEVLNKTTLGSTVVNSSLETLGTVTAGTWEADVIGTPYGGTGQSSYSDGQLLIGNSSGSLSKAVLTSGTGISINNLSGDIEVINSDRGSAQDIFKRISDADGIDQFSADGNNDQIRFEGIGGTQVLFDSSSNTIRIESQTASGLLIGGDGIEINEQSEIEVDDTIVRTFGDQTLTGTKTFNSTIDGDITGNAETASALNPGRSINGVLFDGTQDIELPPASTPESLFAGDGLDSTGPFDGTVERTFTNIDKGSDQSIFKTVQNEVGVNQFNASVNSDVIRFAAGGDLNIEFDSVNNQIKYVVNVAESEVASAGDGIDVVDNEVSVDNTVVRTTDVNQTIDGQKTFVNALELGTQATALGQAIRADREIDTGEGLIGGGTLDSDLLLEVDETVVRTSGEQSVAGTKTFVNTIIATSADPGLFTNGIASGTSEFDLIDEQVSTINFGGEATEINIGASTGKTNFGHDVNLSVGKGFQIDGSTILAAESLGSSVVGSSLTSVGTIESGVWNGSTISEEFGGTGKTTYNDGELLIGKTDGSLDRSTLSAGANITIDNGDGSITINGTDFTAGDGIVRSGNEFSVIAGNGLIQESNGLSLDFDAIDVEDIDGSVTIQESLGVGTTASGIIGEIRATDQITAFFSSDKRLKKNVKDIESPIDSIKQIRGVTFDWTDEEIEYRGGEDDFFVRKHSVGVIAQEIEKVLPEAVAVKQDGYMGVRYELLVPLLIQGMKDQQSQIEMLQEKVDNLCQRL